MSIISSRLEKLGIILPNPSPPLAAYVPYVIVDNVVYISGQLPLEDGELKYTGRVGETVDIPEGQAAARLCALNILAHLSQATEGDLDGVDRCVKIGGFVSSAHDFFDQPKVINGASELILQVFGESGRHARFAVGVNNLPRQASVEVDAVFSLRKS